MKLYYKLKWLGISGPNSMIIWKKKLTITSSKSQMCKFLSCVFYSIPIHTHSCSQLWYSKMNMLRKKETEDGALKRGESMQAHLMANFSSRKDFLPAFPNEAEKPHVPFQQSRLLLSHMGFIHYHHLKNGSFQMLNKTPALYRDLRGLDRKHG